MKKFFLVICLLILFVFSGYSQACVEYKPMGIPVVTDVSSGINLVSPTVPGRSFFNVVQGKSEEVNTCNIVCEKPREGDEYNKSTPTIPYCINGGEHACNHACNCVCPLCLINRSGKPLEKRSEGVNYNGYTGINLNEETGLWPNKRGYDLVYKWPTYNSGSFLIVDDNICRLDKNSLGTLSTPKRGDNLVLKYPIYNNSVVL